MLPPKGRWAPSGGPVWRGPGTAALPRSQRDAEASPLSSKKMYVALGGAGGEVTLRDPAERQKQTDSGVAVTSPDTFSDGERFHHHVRALCCLKAGRFNPTGQWKILQVLNHPGDGDASQSHNSWSVSRTEEDCCVSVTFKSFCIHTPPLPPPPHIHTHTPSAVTHRDHS